MNEIWTTLIYKNQNFNNEYKISNTGKIIKTKTGKERSKKKRNGFYYVDISFNKTIYSINLHKAIGKIFLPNPNNYKFLLFKDGNRENCSVENLEWSPFPFSLLNENKIDKKNRLTKIKSIKTRNLKRIQEKRKAIKQKCVEYKGDVCQHCGYHKSLNALEFHHINPSEKTATIAELCSKNWEIIKKELDKCILLCSNCHREIEGETSLKEKYGNNPNTNEKQLIKQEEKRRLNKKKALEYLGGKCQVCGYNKFSKALECHHMNPEKKEEKLCELYSKPWAIIQKELDKCVLVCSNCHREIHDGITPCPEPLHKDLE